MTPSPSKTSVLKTYFPAIFVWIIMMAAGLFKWIPILRAGQLPGNDDYMRLVEVRDWLSGQAWTDMTQFRLFPPDPLQSHWARLPDIMVGGVIKVLTPLVGSANAELAALIIVPAGLLLVMLILVVALARRVSDNPWMPLATALMAGLCAPLIQQFSPGRIDHHGLQIVLALGTALCILKSAKHPKWSFGAGILCGTGLWIGIESAPYVAAACLVIGLIWVLQEIHAAKRLRYFALSLIGASSLLLITSRPLEQWFSPACDALSSVYILACGGATFAMVICSLITPRSIIARLSMIGGLGLAAIAITGVVFPQCLKGPYSELDPRLAEVWLNNVSEAERFYEFFPKDPVVGTALIVIPLMGIIAMALRMRKTGLAKGLILAPVQRSLFVFTIITLLAGLLQLRLMTFAGAFAAPLAAILMSDAMDWSEKLSGDVKRAFTRAGILLGLSPLALPLLVSVITPNDEIADPTATGTQLMACQSAKALKPLNSLPEGFAISQIDLGAPLLAATHLSVSSAPYHRNEIGNTAALDIFMGEENTAENAAKALKANYLIACKDYPETQLMTSMAPNGLLAKLKAGEVPNWLEPIDLGDKSPLLAYKIK